jgi:AcrR family transcriptional regulator
MTRGNTRQRILDVALELFLKQGYEHTSLREIAERVEVTKAALYYHFKTKEDLLQAIADSLSRPLDELLAWAKGRPRDAALRAEVLERYADALAAAEPLFRLVQDNQAVLREMQIGITYKERAQRLVQLIEPEDGGLADSVRAFTALLAVHAAHFALRDREAPADEKRAAALAVALEVAERIEGGAGKPGGR